MRKKRAQVFNTNEPKKAIIYCRVSSRDQVINGNGLGSQEIRCRDYCIRSGYDIDSVIKEGAISGAKIERDGLTQLVSEVERLRKSKIRCVVVFDEISRITRAMEVYHSAFNKIYALGGEIESPQMKFEDSAIGRFISSNMALTAQLHRDLNTEQVCHRMEARLLGGYWPFPASVGYKRDRFKNLIPSEPVASIIRDVFKRYAAGNLSTLQAVLRFLQDSEDFPRGKRSGSIKVEKSVPKRILTNRLYCGLVGLEKWDIAYRKGQHEPLISVELFELVQNRLAGKSVVADREDKREKFPLRGFVLCHSCHRPMTASSSTGRKRKRYPYYHCSNRECNEKSGNIRQVDLEGAFIKLLESLTPKPGVTNLTAAIVNEVYRKKIKDFDSENKRIQRDLEDSKNFSAKLIDRIVRSDDAELNAAFNEELKKRRATEHLLEEKLTKRSHLDTSFGTALNLVSEVLNHPVKLWEKGTLNEKQLVLKLVFAKKIPYSRETGFGTALTSLPYRIICHPETIKDGNVDPIGIEPTTSTMPLWRSPS
jgi:site-specific DNA recombinase